MAKKTEEETPVNSLGLRPEQIVKFYEENGKLTDDFNPYEGYTVNPSTDFLFIGDKKPQNVPDGYNNADFFFAINDRDPDRRSIFISLPKPPRIELIDNYELPQDEQFFRRKMMPDRLKKLEQETLVELQSVKKNNRQEAITGHKILDLFWSKMEDNAKTYKEEIDFIKKVWYHRIYGYWFMNDGKPTYITGRHFMFLNFFYIPDVRKNNGKPEYRDRHRREFLYREFLR
jgi:hypothetical protein